MHNLQTLALPSSGDYFHDGGSPCVPMLWGAVGHLFEVPFSLLITTRLHPAVYDQQSDHSFWTSDALPDEA